MLTPIEKSPLPENVPRGGSNRDAVDSEPKHYQLSYSGPLKVIINFKEEMCIPLKPIPKEDTLRR